MLDSGELYTWGYGSNGRLGHGDQGDQLVPLRVEGLKDVKIIHASCGGYHTAAVSGRFYSCTTGENSLVLKKLGGIQRMANYIHSGGINLVNWVMGKPLLENM